MNARSRARTYSTPASRPIYKVLLQGHTGVLSKACPATANPSQQPLVGGAGDSVGMFLHSLPEPSGE